MNRIDALGHLTPLLSAEGIAFIMRLKLDENKLEVVRGISIRFLLEARSSLEPADALMALLAGVEAILATSISVDLN